MNWNEMIALSFFVSLGIYLMNLYGVSKDKCDLYFDDGLICLALFVLGTAFYFSVWIVLQYIFAIALGIVITYVTAKIRHWAH